MAVLAWITGIILTLGFLMAGGMKLMGQPMALEMADKLGYTNLRQMIGGAEVLGAIGVFVGILSDDRGLEWAGFLAALGLIALMIGAVVYHLRAGDGPKDFAPAIVLAIVAVLYIVGIGGR